MAIVKPVRGIKVTIHVDKKPLQEYDDDEFEVAPGINEEYQTSRTVAKYVESVSDKEFGVNICVDKSFRMDCPNLSAAIEIDGVLVTNIILEKSALPM